MRTSYGYDTYRGRSKLQTALTVLIIILLVVLLLAVCAFFLLQKYMVYTDDGQAHLELPFLSGQEETPPPVPTQGQELVLITPSPTATPEPTPAVEELEPVSPVSLFRSSLLDGTAPRLVTGAGGDAALFNMKANDGSLGYVSALPLAVSARSSAADAGLNEKIRALTATELYTIARVSCFKDNLAPKADGSLAIKTNSGYNWRDEEEIRWMNPSFPQVREYVVGVCTELAGLGFDEILLDNSGWPSTGNLSYIKVGEDYDPDHLSEEVERFYQELQGALKETGVTLSVAVDAAALKGDQTACGQTAALLGQYAERVYVLGWKTLGDCDQILADQGLTGGRVLYVEQGVADLSTTGRLVAAQPE